MVKLRKKLGGMVRLGGVDSQVTDLVDRCNQEAPIISPPSAFAPLPDSTFGPPVAASGANPEDKNAKKLIGMMRSLALSVRALQAHLGQAQIGVSQPSLLNPPFQLAGNPAWRSTCSSFPAGVDKCL